MPRPLLLFVMPGVMRPTETTGVMTIVLISVMIYVMQGKFHHLHPRIVKVMTVMASVMTVKTVTVSTKIETVIGRIGMLVGMTRMCWVIAEGKRGPWMGNRGTILENLWNGNKP